MTPTDAVTSLVAALGALVDDRDAVSTLASLVRSSADAVPGAVAGVLVTTDFAHPDPADLDLLAASSHGAGDLELYQVQTGAGPCFDAIDGDADVSVVGADRLRERWPDLGGALVDAGFTAAHALPLRWRGTPFGALNLFVRGGGGLTAEQRAVERGFADVAAATVVHAGDPPGVAELARAVRSTIAARAVVDQAKGALRYLLELDEGTAFAVLARRAEDADLPLTVVAREVLDAAQRGARPDWLRAAGA